MAVPPFRHGLAGAMLNPRRAGSHGRGEPAMNAQALSLAAIVILLFPIV